MSEFVDLAGVSVRRAFVRRGEADTLLAGRHVPQAGQAFSEVAEPPVLAARLEVREPRARKIEQHNRQRPHGVNERQPMPVTRWVRGCPEGPVQQP